MEVGARPSRVEKAKLWVGASALAIAIAALGAWQVWIGLLLALPLMVAAFTYAGYAFLHANRREKIADVEVGGLSFRARAAAHFSTFPQVLRLAVAFALLLNLTGFASLSVAAAINSGYVGPNYELSGTYLSASDLALHSLGSLATLSALGLLVGIMRNRSAQTLAGERGALEQQAGAWRLIKLARIFNVATIITFLIASVAGLLLLAILAAS